MASLYSPSLAEAIRRTEDACRRLNDVCVKATDAVMGARSPRLHEATRFVMDTWHVANATARLLGRFADYEPQTLAMMVSACRQIAIQCAWSCETTRDALSLEECERSCEATAATCAELLGLLWDETRNPSDEGCSEPPVGASGGNGSGGRTAAA